MDSIATHIIDQPDSRVAPLINEYFDRRAAGEGITPEAFAGEHPEKADELRPYLAGLSMLERLRPAADEATHASAMAAASAGRPGIEGYELLEEIGRGGMGVVYKALQVSTKRVVALKVMLVGPFASHAALRRFDREVELAARLQHPDIVRVLESGRDNGWKYYAMDYVEGTRLDQFVKATQTDLPSLLAIIERVCKAVDYAHRHGVIHRDLKPANVLLDGDGRPHVLDFGLAKATDRGDPQDTVVSEVSVPGQVVGTLFYLSPEQAVGASEEVDVRTDVYSLGVMFYEAVTGALPFDTDGRPSQVIQRILETPPTAPSSLSKQVNGELETILLKALEKDRDLRYQSAAEFGADIRRYRDGEPILARRPSGLYLLRKKLVKHRWATVLCALAATLVLTGSVAKAWSKRQRIDDARRTALAYQVQLDDGPSSIALGPAKVLHQESPDVSETAIHWAHAQYCNRAVRPHGILFLEGIVRRHPDRWACCLLLAEMHEAAGDPHRAAELTRQAERSAPDTADAWYLRSLATLDAGRAAQCAEEAVALSPSHVLAWHRLAWLRTRSGDLDGAFLCAERLLALGEDPATWTLFMGKILSRQGRFDEAVVAYTKAVDMDAVGGVRLYRAHAYRRLKEFDKAVADYTAIIEPHCDRAEDVWEVYQRATPLWILGRRDEALADYRRVRTALGKPFFSDARSFLILREMGRVQDADRLLESAVKETDDPWLRDILRCLAGQLTPDDLVSVAIERDNPQCLCEAYYYAGEACLLNDDRVEARGFFERCVRTGLEFDPDTALATPMNEFELAQWRLDSIKPDLLAYAPERN